jgi:hypothetical protein
MKKYSVVSGIEKGTHRYMLWLLLHFSQPHTPRDPRKT